MNCCHYDPTLAEALSDPIVRALMRADGVDPRELEASLTDMARQVRRRSRRRMSRATRRLD